MTVTGQLKKALKSVCSEVARDKYEGKKDTYIVYNVAHGTSWELCRQFAT